MVIGKSFGTSFGGIPKLAPTPAPKKQMQPLATNQIGGRKLMQKAAPMRPAAQPIPLKPRGYLNSAKPVNVGGQKVNRDNQSTVISQQTMPLKNQPVGGSMPKTAPGRAMPTSMPKMTP